MVLEKLGQWNWVSKTTPDFFFFYSNVKVDKIFNGYYTFCGMEWGEGSEWYYDQKYSSSPSPYLTPKPYKYEK